MPTDNNYWGNPQGQPLQSAQQPEQQPVSQPQSAQQSEWQPEPAQQPESQFAQQPQPEPQQQSAQQQPAQQWQQPQPAQQPAQQWQQATGYAAPAVAPAAPYQAPAAQPQKSRGWIVAIVVIVCIFLLSAFAIKSCTDTMSSFTSLGPSFNSSGYEQLTEDAIAIIDIDGTIQYDGSACSPEGLKELLDEAEADDHIKGVVLRVNSGGGTATAGEEMALYVREFSKPVVVSSAAINASAAYEISSQADYIYVVKSTEIGAIGTAMEVMDLSGLLEMLGVNMDTITSADQKDSSYGYRPLTDEERAYYQQMVDDINAVFIDNVAEGRGMTKDEVTALATGMPFTGVTAVENGLADAIGTREDAIDKCAELAGITNYTTTNLYFSEYDLSSLAYLLGKDNSSTDEIAKLLEAAKNGNIN
ncbi:MAG: signal peptide peptidase SppA [Eggerthellaceae bacterium]|nr:signal peptide peptidase SppA [Eggerthellaceae bacterium]